MSAFALSVPFSIPVLRLGKLAAVLSLLSACAAPPPQPNGAPIDINLVALNDFHGNLESSPLSYTSITDHTPHSIQAGGIDAVAATLQAWRKQDPQLLLVGAGDLVGASPAISGMWADEPTIGAMNLLGLTVTSVGNHEFDAGRLELLRQQNGGCVSPRPEKACQFTPTYDGAKFTYLAANVIDHQTGQPFMPAYRIEQSHGVKIAFIGAVLKETAAASLASGIAGLDFIDEADAVNRMLPALRAQGVGVFVVLIHQGGKSADAFDQPDCGHLSGPIVDVVKRLDPAIRLVISGHSHLAYTCRVDGRLVTQAETAGHMLSRIVLQVSPDGQRVLAVSARNVIVRPGEYPADAAADAYLASVRARGAAVLARPVARLALAKVAEEYNDAGELPLGDLVADSMLASARHLGAQIAFMNRGGTRTDLRAGADLVTNHGQTQAVLPFGNRLMLMTLSGAQIRGLLEQNWPHDDTRGVLQVSAGFSYQWDAARPEGQRVVAASVTLDGQPLGDSTAYRVVVSNFLAEGGDHFAMFKDGTARLDTGVRDGDALRVYLAAQDRAGQPAGFAQPVGRIQRLH